MAQAWRGFAPVVACFALLPAAYSLAEVVRGVIPELQDKYVDTGVTFRCLDGSAEVLRIALNDDFCDCKDGSDEPGTGACAGHDNNLFYCPNHGSTPRLLYASRIDDGVCDCCDGSDEGGLAARHPSKACRNRCESDGVREAEERQRRMTSLREGLVKKEDIIKAAAKDRSKWKDELAALEAEHPKLQAAVDAAKADESNNEEVDIANAGANDGEIDKLKTTIAAQQKTIDALQAEVKDLKKRCGDSDSPDVAEKAVVSEYAKWMDGAETTPGVDGESETSTTTQSRRVVHMADPLASAKLESVSGLTEDDEGEEDYSDEESDSDDEGDDHSAAADTSSPLGIAQGILKANRRDAKSLSKKLDSLTDDKLGYAELLTNCLDAHVGEHDYKICVFGKADQQGTSLGEWAGWTGPKTAHFANGAMCYGGPARKLTIKFECGSEGKLLELTEPSRCLYHADVAHPGACDASDAVALTKPPLSHPKDEL